MSLSAYRQLEEGNARISALEGALAVLHWDRSVIMPEGGADARAEQIATLGLIVHELQTDPRRTDLIEAALAETGELDAWQAANLREMARASVRARAVPPALVDGLARAKSATEMAWRRAQAEADFSLVAERLAGLVELVREEAAILGERLELDPYDALLDKYDAGLRAAFVAPLFDRLAAELPALLDAVIDRQHSLGEPLALDGPFPVSEQERLGRTVMERLGFDFHHGRLDVSHHPFTGGVPDDSRITTRYETGSFIQALMAVIHETGHSLYERGLPAEWRGQPVGEARGMVMHESQSLLFEMQAARGPAFIGYLSGLAAEIFDRSGPAWEPENLLRHYHKVERSLIRVYADEVSYPLHVIHRTRLEQAMISGALAVRDLPQAWNGGMAELLGVAPANDREGCLQDIHWYSGAFGYFPTYTLGALTAAQLFRAALMEAPSIEAGLAEGRGDGLLAWARRRVHEQGSLVSTAELIESACGEPLGADRFLDHLRTRYLP
jgi:carboxypeptidase Taq